MKKIISFLTVLVMVFSFVPSLASAQTTSDTQTTNSALQALLNLLLQELASLEQQYTQLMQNQQSSQQSVPPTTQTSPTVAPTPVAVTTPSINYDAYQQVDWIINNEDPAAYEGDEIMMFALTDGVFLPEGGNGGSSNFIELGDGVQAPEATMEIDDQNDYSAAITALSSSDGMHFIKVWGTASAPKQFTLTNGNTSYIPVIVADRLDVCRDSISILSLAVSDLSESNCPDGWQTVFPAGIPSVLPISNTQGGLNVSLVVNNSQGGTATPASFTITVIGSNPTPSTFIGSTSATQVIMDANKFFGVNVSPLRGYTASNNGNCASPAGLTGGMSENCIITETYAPAAN